MPSLLARPPYDKELKSSLDAMNLKPNTHITPTDIPSLRLQHTPNMSYIQSLLDEYGIEHEERIIDGPAGDLVLSIFRSKSTSKDTALSPPGGGGGEGEGEGGKPGIYFTHGGGMISGTRFMGIELALDWVHHLNAICISPEYRLAPEYPHPAPIEDCYAGLVYTFAHAVDLGIDAKRMVTAGLSAGGGLAAGLALMCRDRYKARGGPELRLCAQLLICPMLDDRVDTVSSRQFVDEGVWCRGSNITGWNSLLGSRRGTEEVSIYAAPARAAASPSKLSGLPPTGLAGPPPTSPAGLPPTSLSGLPPTFIDVGEAEVFRDECVAYASHLWASGVQTELHVWPGAWHAFDLFAPGARVSVVARETRRGWLGRLLEGL